MSVKPLDADHGRQELALVRRSSQAEELELFFLGSFEAPKFALDVRNICWNLGVYLIDFWSVLRELFDVDGFLHLRSLRILRHKADQSLGRLLIFN